LDEINSIVLLLIESMRGQLRNMSVTVFAVLVSCASRTVDEPKDSGGAGMDAASCSSANCAGCCSNGVCQPGTIQAACGRNGATCATCSPVQACTAAQSCALDPTSKWRIQPTSAQVASTNQGSDWDIGGGAPDPFVELWCPSTAATSVRTPTVNDSYMPTWSSGGCTMTEIDLLSVGFAVAVWDEDVSVNDPISGKGTIAPTEANLNAAFINLTAMPTLITMTVALEKQ
jgi:hypothetical protein